MKNLNRVFTRSMNSGIGLFNKNAVLIETQSFGAFSQNYWFLILFTLNAGIAQIQRISRILHSNREQQEYQDDKSEQKKRGRESESDCHCFVSRSDSLTDGPIITPFRHCQNSLAADSVGSRLAESVHRSVLPVVRSEGALFDFFSLRMWGASKRSNLSTSSAQRSCFGTWWMRDSSIYSGKWIRARYFASWRIPQNRAKGTRKMISMDRIGRLPASSDFESAVLASGKFLHLT